MAAPSAARNAADHSFSLAWMASLTAATSTGGAASGAGAALYTEDAAGIQATGDWDRGREAIAKRNNSQFDSTTYTSREDITEEVIPAGPDYIFEVGRYASAGTAKVGGKPKTSSGRYAVLWRKDADGVWRMHRDIGTEAPVKP